MYWYGWRESNLQSFPYQGNASPLSYSRIFKLKQWGGRRDLNPQKA